MPPIHEIVAYWSHHMDECGLNVDLAEASERCWRCGYKSKLERCHIVPSSLHGPDTASNLVLLCSRCHREAPNSINPEYMWIWIRNNGTPFYDTYWTIRGTQEFENMFKRKPFAGISVPENEELREMLRQEMQKAIVHFGEGRVNPSTIACIMAELEARLFKKS